MAELFAAAWKGDSVQVEELLSLGERTKPLGAMVSSKYATA